MGAGGRDLKGWNPAAIAVFHESKAALELLLNHGADPYLRSSYNKSAWDMAQDDFDAAGRVVRSRLSCCTKCVEDSMEHVPTSVATVVIVRNIANFRP